MNNYRMGGYLLFAIGLINLRYQWGEPGIVQRSAAIFIPGALILLATFIAPLKLVLMRKEVQYLLAFAGLAIVAYAVTN
ncbi:MAG: hypothetical protein F2649_01645 [Actinobacteria bacterium]|uniref:Unannotated protein n=1 Tax=freshwater metagenome TaxID=449393 RepID=A0A6J6B2S5_9ZZZZ|nr:hypothetical protein [Actinomycetota bacterium]MTA19706.1 hypothetical protein [Actinomycetota bacterium]